VTFSEGGQFEGGRVRRGGRGRGIAVGGGIGTILVAVVVMLMGGDPSQILQGQPATDPTLGAGQAEVVEDCSAEEANARRDCRLSATVQFLDTYWERVLPEQADVQYAKPPVESFSGSTTTGCGAASSQTGPFYCPPDQTIYMDLAFFDVLQSQFGTQGGPLAEIYVTAHEMGHHVENLIGVMAAADRSGTGPESDSVRLELMADCLAGMAIGNAATEVDPDTGVTFLEPITKQELQQALDAAAAVGDDHIQQRTTGELHPESYTHGTSEQRVSWFAIGYNGGTLADCDAMSASSL
jgi:predicted metalloprotease